MAATGNEVVLIRQAKIMYDELAAAISAAADGKYAAKSHTHANATTSADGFMSSEDKTKLDGLSNYTLPTASDTDFKSYLGIS